MAKRLTETDQDFIIFNFEKMTDKEMSEVLLCSIRSIERFRKKAGLSKKKTNKPIVETNIKHSNEREFYEKQFISSPRGRRVKTHITLGEWPTFIDEWVEYHTQLEDLTFTEENNIEQIIILKLRMDRNQMEYKSSVELKESLMIDNQISDLKDLDLTDPEQADIYEKAYSASIRMTDLNKEYKELLDKTTKLQEILNVTRKQREEGGRVGADTFFALCKQFEDKEFRNRSIRMTELLKMSSDSNTNKLREAMEYMDGEIAPQLLDSKTLDEMEKNKNEK
jgi:hypothetical protein